MAKYKAANSGGRDHIPEEMEGSCQKLKIERLVNSCTLNSKVRIGNSQLPFTTSYLIVLSACSTK